MSRFFKGLGENLEIDYKILEKNENLELRILFWICLRWIQLIYKIVKFSVILKFENFSFLEISPDNSFAEKTKRGTLRIFATLKYGYPIQVTIPVRMISLKDDTLYSLAMYYYWRT